LRGCLAWLTVTSNRVADRVDWAVLMIICWTTKCSTVTPACLKATLSAARTVCPCAVRHTTSLAGGLDTGKEREHGLKYQAVVLPNGLCVLNGPFLGPEHDATCMLLSALETELHALTLSLNAPHPLCVYGDCAYRASNYVVPAVPYHMASPRVRRLNDHMKKIRGPGCTALLSWRDAPHCIAAAAAPVRLTPPLPTNTVLVENLFSCVDQLWSHMTAKYSLKMGKSPIGRH